MICLLGGATLHAAQLVPDLATGTGKSLVLLPLNLMPFAVLYWQGRRLKQEPEVHPAGASLSVLATAALITAAGAIGYYIATESHSLFSPLLMLLTPVALGAIAPVLCRGIYCAAKSTVR